MTISTIPITMAISMMTISTIPITMAIYMTITIAVAIAIARLSSCCWLSLCLSLTIVSMVAISTIAISMAIAMTIAIARLSKSNTKKGKGNSNQKFHVDSCSF